MNTYNCKFKLYPNGLWKCVFCGYEHPEVIDKPPDRECPVLLSRKPCDPDIFPRYKTINNIVNKIRKPISNNCDFHLNPDGLWQCIHCNWVYPHPTKNPPKRNCPVLMSGKPVIKIKPSDIPSPSKVMNVQHNNIPTRQLPHPPTVTGDVAEEGGKLGWTPQMIRRYASAITEWIAAGRPVRDDEEVKRIYEICAGTEENNHTDKCPKFKADEGRCSVCGCRVRNAGLAILNKAKLSTAHCPDGKW
jgi:hypothetical protein